MFPYAWTGFIVGAVMALAGVYMITRALNWMTRSQGAMTFLPGFFGIIFGLIFLLLGIWLSYSALGWLSMHSMMPVWWPNWHMMGW